MSEVNKQWMKAGMDARALNWGGGRQTCHWPKSASRGAECLLQTNRRSNMLYMNLAMKYSEAAGTSLAACLLKQMTLHVGDSLGQRGVHDVCLA
jgi:hypothetical protein